MIDFRRPDVRRSDMTKLRPGQVRDGIEQFLRMEDNQKGASSEAIGAYLDAHIGSPVARSSVRSYLGNNTPGRFERVGRGKYRLTSANRV